MTQTWWLTSCAPLRWVSEMRVRILLILALLWPAALAAEGKARWVEAEGLARIHSNADSDAARRRALGEALISAALAGGASLQGHSFLQNTRLVSDVAILRATGRILRYEALTARVDQGHWRVRVRALVGPARAQSCSGTRRLSIDATPPVIRLDPNAGAWAGPVAEQLAVDIYEAIGRHPAVILETVAPRDNRRVAAALDYNTLTRGEVAPLPGNQGLDLAIDVRGFGPTAELTLTLTVREPDGRATRTTFSRTGTARANGLLALATDQRRPFAEVKLRQGLVEGVTDFFDKLACQTPQARIEARGGALHIPMGRRHGLTPTSLAFVDDPSDSFGLLEIVALGDRSATLKPLDPTRAAQGFAGRRIYFVEIGR